MTALPAPSRRERVDAPRRHLEIAPTRAQRRARPRLIHAVVTVAGIGAVLLGQLLLSIVVADGAYQISALQSQQRDLMREQEALTEALELRSSTQNLIANAEQMGMVASGNPVFLDLITGAVSGAATAAGGSLTGGQGNLIGNSLLDGSTILDAAALAAAGATVSESAAGADSEAGSPGSIVEASHTTDGAGAGSGASSTPGTTSPGTLPSPTTR
jgi:hypothetical protein